MPPPVVVPLGTSRDSPALELYLPSAANAASEELRPAVIVCSGGSYKWWNHKGEGVPAAQWVASLGCVGCLLHYRLGPWPTPREDLHVALALLRNSPEAREVWRIDASRLAVLGFSAGAHLAAQAVAAGTSIRVLVLVYPPVADADNVDTLEAFRANRLAPESSTDLPCQHPLPASYVVASTNDQVCPPQLHADVVVEGLTEVGVRVTYQRQRLGAHGFGCIPKWTAKCTEWLRAELPLTEMPPLSEFQPPSDRSQDVGDFAEEPDDVAEAEIAELRATHAHLQPDEQASNPASVRGRIVARRQPRGRVQRVFLDLQAGSEQLQLVVQAAVPQATSTPSVASSFTESVGASGDGVPVDDRRTTTYGASRQAEVLTPEIQPGVFVHAVGHPGRIPAGRIAGRGALALFVAPDDISILPEPTVSVSGESPAAVSVSAVAATGRGSTRPDGGEFHTTRFHMTPSTTGWQSALQQLRCGANNNMTWAGGQPLPNAPPGSPGCWLLPASDEVALEIARSQDELRALGWRLLTCDKRVVARLSNKSTFRDHAEALGLLRHLPEHYPTPEMAMFPCIMKGAEGNNGQNVKIVTSGEMLRHKVGLDWASGRVLLQELVPGRVEYSCSLLVMDGEVFDSVVMEYTYDREEFVWPFVKEEKEKRVSQDRVCTPHLSVMRKLLVGYSGICNFNYKVRPGGDIAIFEINTRVGGDLGEDVPRWRARLFLERLNGCSQGT
ncbi:hypothetical protein CYMTET_51596 [Cymbomonas tetramitiformis]|uniref:ATP-grasp domain-containing protein n=1 Tax=Cymbomonas tetramitiformis TaxID=36881 RepID=A0AAE0BM75_9CHLO|nr:hypothetical protein CYMTET_51596 [Cymbomonas tetramitiformis]|eukprot:gene15567-18454_t